MTRGFFFFARGEKIKTALKAGHHRPMMAQHKYWFGSFVISGDLD